MFSLSYLFKACQVIVRITQLIEFLDPLLKIRGSNFSRFRYGLLVGNGRLISSLGAEVLIVGMVVEGIGNGTSCASIPPAVGTKVENGSNNGAIGALGKADPPTF